MRVTANLAPAHPGKRRLLESCAIAAGLMALVHCGPALAQVAGSGTITTLPAGPVTVTPTNPSTVNVSGPQTIIDWTPSNAPVGGVIDFLPTGNSLTYVGNTLNYIVLNRFIAASGTPIADQIALNGTVNSVVSIAGLPTLQNGNIWFYNAGGILIGNGAAINVGSLVLTTNDVITTGGLLGPAGEIRFRGVAASTAPVTIASGASINAGNPFNPGSSYVAVVAPRIVQAGAVRVDGSAAFVAAEQADIRINNGLFDINVLVGAEGGNVITHSGSTTGPAHAQGDADQSRIYLVAIPKNDAVTMLVSGSIGYDDAVSAQVDPDGAVRLSAGYNIFGGELDGAPTNTTAANITVNDTLFRSDTVARASGALLGQPLLQVPPVGPSPSLPPPHVGRVIVQGNGTFIGDASATFNVGAGQVIGATGNLTLVSGGANGAGGNAAVNVTGGQLLTGGTLAVVAGGPIDATTGNSDAGTASFTMTGGAVQLGDLFVAADAEAGVGSGGTAGTGTGGIATIDLLAGVLNTASITVSATGIGGAGPDGSDDNSANIIPGGPGGTGVGGSAAINIDGAVVTATGAVAAYANGQGGAGGNFSAFGGIADAGGRGGAGQGGTATVEMRSGTLNTGDLIAGAGGFGGDGGNVFASSSSGSVIGIGIGGDGGTGQGGTATLDLAAPVNAMGAVTSTAAAAGGNGGRGLLGGSGGDALGGLAQIIVTDFSADPLLMTVDASAVGGDGAFGDNGAGGGGGDGTGGTGRIQATGGDGHATLSQANFQTSGSGGSGGGAGSSFFGGASIGAAGGDGGSGRGGTLEILASDGATILLDSDGGGLVSLASDGTGGGGGNGAFNGFGTGFVGGDGGDGGAATGGTVRLFANGGTITSGSSPVSINASGIAGTGGAGGTGTSGNGAAGAVLQTSGGLALIEAAGGETPALVNLGVTTIAANGDLAGRIEIRTAGGGAARMTSLAAEALGDAPPTNNDTDVAPAGIFFAANGGTIATTGNMTLTTDSSFGAYAGSNGTISAGGDLTIDAGDQIDIRHDVRAGIAPTIQAGGDLTATAGSISGAPGSLLSAGGTLALTSTLGAIGVDRLNGTDILITAAGAASVEHADALNGFAATGASFRTGLNSINTGGDILIASPGAVDLGNSTAGGFVQVGGQSILFNSITAGGSVALTASGTTAGAEGIAGGSITAAGNVNLTATRIAISGAITGANSLFVNGNAGPVAIALANIDDDISVFASGDITGVYNAVGDIRLTSQANIAASANAAGFESSSSGTPIAASVFIDAAGNVVVANGSATGMFGVNAGGSTALSGVNAGEDVLVLAGTTATLANITAGDDLTAVAAGGIIASGLTTTGTGPDDRSLVYLAGRGFTISQGEGVNAANGSDIVLSAGGAIGAAALSAADDIFAATTGAIAINGATTLGLGAIGGSSDIRTQGGDTALADLDAATDVLVTSAGTLDATGPVSSGRDIVITAAAANLATLGSPGGGFDNSLDAAANLTVTTSGDIVGGRVRAGGDLTLTGGRIDIVRAQTTGTGPLTLTGTNGVNAANIQAGGATLLNASNGAVTSDGLISTGPVTVTGDRIDLDTGGDIVFAVLDADVGDAVVTNGSGTLTITSSVVAGRTTLTSENGNDIIISALAANAADISAEGDIVINGVLTARNIALESNDIIIASGARVGTAGSTETLSIENNDVFSQTFVGGTGTRSGFHLDANELTRLFGTDIEIFAPEVQAVRDTSVGSTAPPDIIIDSFTLAGGAAGSNLGANGALTIRTPGKMRVIGNVQLTGLSDTNALNLTAGDALEVILGQGTIRLVNGTAAAGQLNLMSDDIIVATTAAITDVGAATTTDAIEARLAQNDGVVIDDGALFARGIRANVIGGFYVQNSGTGTEFASRRGLTFGTGGLDVITEGPSRIVINGVQAGPNGQVTGRDATALLTIGGAAPSPGSFDPRSTFNGCLIANPAACGVLPPPEPEFESNFPVQDVIEEEADAESEDGDGQSLPVPLITTRDLDPLSGEPLLDDPVTGAGNDDLWIPTEGP